MKNYLILLFISTLFVACGGNDSSTKEEDDLIPTVDYDTYMVEIKALEDAINTEESPSDSLLKEGIIKFQEFAGFFPEDPKAPDYLLKASDFSYTTKQFEKSVKILSRIMADYPDYERMEDVMFNKASHLDFELRDTTRAKEAYQEFIDKYPNSELVDDAETRIKNIRFSAEDLIEIFMKDLEEQPN